MRFEKMERIGKFDKGKFVRVDADFTVCNLKDGQNVTLHRGVVGNILSARVGTITVGFQNDFRPPRASIDPNNFDLTVVFDDDDVKAGKLSLQA
jgi:hypothetical protein